MVTILENLLIGRAGNRPRALAPTMIAIHGEEDLGNPHNYFMNVKADSTCWIARDGHIERYLLDSDIAWTEGDIAEPMMHNNPVIEGYLAQGITNFNAICLSVELEGWNSENDAVTHRYNAALAHPTPAQYQALIALCLYWCKTWNIPPDRNHIVRHADIGQHKGCPGSMANVDQVARDVAAAYQAQALSERPAPTPVQDAWHCTVANHDFWVTNDQGFWSHYQQHGGTIAFGLPISGAFTSHNIDGSNDDGRVIQAFERTILAAYPENQPPYAVQGLLITDPAYGAVLSEALSAKH